MTMTLNGLAKLSEELGELQQIVGKMMAYGKGPHPDGTSNLHDRFEEEAGDVVASILFVNYTHNLNLDSIKTRSIKKLKKFFEWHFDENA